MIFRSKTTPIISSISIEKLINTRTLVKEFSATGFYVILVKVQCTVLPYKDYNLGDGTGELSDDGTTKAESEADFISNNGEITPPMLTEEYTEILDEPLETPDALDDTASNVYREVSTRGTIPADEEVFEGYPI